MRRTHIAYAVALTFLLSSSGLAQVKPDTPNDWGMGAAENAQANTGNGETVTEAIGTLGGRGFSGARHDDAEPHPTPPSGVEVPVGN